LSLDSGRKPFPAGFVWGAATSAYQIEGAARAGGRGESIWDAFCRRPHAVRNGDTGDIATDHYHRYREDIDLMADLGLRSYRFSVAWPRIQPTGEGPPIRAGLDFYERLTDSLLEAGISPMVTLYHWDLPQALQDRGGWPARETAHRFADYAQTVLTRLHDRVRRWGTINEPSCVAFPGYWSGEGAPGECDPARAIRAVHHVLLAHGLAVQAMRAVDPGAELGIVLNLHPARAVTADPPAPVVDGVRRLDAIQNRLFLDPILRGTYPDDALVDLGPYGELPIEPGDSSIVATPLDWLGINYYFDRIVESDDTASAPWPLFPGLAGVRLVPISPDQATDMGWPITPSGLRDLLVRLTIDYPSLPPLFVTENGAAYDDPIDQAGRIDDWRRIAYLDGHITAVREAIAHGVDVRGYYVWSLLDNFEWTEGYAKRFGLVHVDHSTLRRTPRRSAAWYHDVIARNGLPPTPKGTPTPRRT
jgi:beta-glucosidase